MFRVYMETSGNKPLIFGGGSPDGSPSEDISGVQFVNGTRPGNTALVDLAKRQVGNVGRLSLLELVRLQFPRGVVCLFRELVLQSGGRKRAALFRLSIAGRPVVSIAGTMGCEGL